MVVKQEGPTNQTNNKNSLGKSLEIFAAFCICRTLSKVALLNHEHLVLFIVSYNGKVCRSFVVTSDVLNKRRLDVNRCNTFVQPAWKKKCQCKNSAVQLCTHCELLVYSMEVEHSLRVSSSPWRRLTGKRCAGWCTSEEWLDSTQYTAHCGWEYGEATRRQFRCHRDSY